MEQGLARRGSTHRLMRWLWTSRRLDARLTRLALLPAAGLWRAGSAARSAAYSHGWLSQSRPVLPTIAIANLTVGDSGKVPVLAWIARHLEASGLKPGIVLRAVSPWRSAALQHAVHGVPVTSGDSSIEGIARLAAAGATVAVVESDIPPREIIPAALIAVIGAETGRAVRWPVPAGPWREGWGALERADAVIITRKRATAEAAEDFARALQQRVTAPIAIAHLGMRHLEGLVSRTEQPATVLVGRRVVAASGSADPGAFVSQIKAAGAAVQVASWEATDDLRDEDVAWLAHAARRADYVVVSEQDAVKLRERWPARVAEPLVAIMDLTWERNGEALTAVLDAVVTSAGNA